MKRYFEKNPILIWNFQINLIDNKTILMICYIRPIIILIY